MRHLVSFHFIEQLIIIKLIRARKFVQDHNLSKLLQVHQLTFYCAKQSQNTKNNYRMNFLESDASHPIKAAYFPHSEWMFFDVLFHRLKFNRDIIPLVTPSWSWHDLMTNLLTLVIKIESNIIFHTILKKTLRKWNKIRINHRYTHDLLYFISFPLFHILFEMFLFVSTISYLEYGNVWYTINILISCLKTELYSSKPEKYLLCHMKYICWSWTPVQ